MSQQQQHQADEPSSSLPPSLVSLEAERNQSAVLCAFGSLAAGFRRSLEECVANPGVYLDFPRGNLPYNKCIFISSMIAPFWSR